MSNSFKTPKLKWWQRIARTILGGKLNKPKGAKGA